MHSAGCCHRHRDFLMVCELPCEDGPGPADGPGRRRLHCDNEPAVRWPDGWTVYAIHGIRVPRSVVENPESITFRAIEQERNAEDRRVMVERYGWGRYMADCRSQVVDAVPEDHPILGLQGARLIHKELLGEPEPLVYLEMLNSTPKPDGSRRRYLLRIDPGVYGGDAGRSCHAAMASLWHHRDAHGVLELTCDRTPDFCEFANVAVTAHPRTLPLRWADA
jgi:hypothetical protein